MAKDQELMCEKCVHSTRDTKGHFMCHATRELRPFQSNEVTDIVCPFTPPTTNTGTLTYRQRREMINEIVHLEPYAFEDEELKEMSNATLMELYDEMVIEVEAEDEDEAQSKSLNILLDKIAKEHEEKEKEKEKKTREKSHKSYFGRLIPDKKVQVKEKRSILTCKSRFDDIV